MKDLIEALGIFLKYGNQRNPTNCSHDELYVCIDPEDVSVEDKIRSEELWFIENGRNGFMSFRLGSC